MSEQEEKIEGIKKVSNVKEPIKTALQEMIDAHTQDQQRVPPNKEAFDRLMSQNDGAGTPVVNKTAAQIAVEPTSNIPLMDQLRNLNSRVDGLAKVSPAHLVAQAEEVINHIETIKQKLATPTIDLTPGMQSLIKHKLSHVDENLRVALSQAGVEYKPHTEASSSMNAIDRFLGFLTHSQTELKSLSGEVEQWHLNNKDISPATMLSVQIKVGYIQQEIEFFTAVLNKALESTKTIMNIQV